MTVLFMLIPLTLVLVGLACWAFFWAVGNGQFDDLDSPSWEVLHDEPAAIDHKREQQRDQKRDRKKERNDAR